MLDRFRAARRAYQVGDRRWRRARQREEGGTARPAAAAATATGKLRSDERGRERGKREARGEREGWWI